MDSKQAPNAVTPPDPSPIQDPEARREADEIKVKRMRLEYWKELAGVVAVWLQMFKTEAVSLVSGVGTLVLGWYQLRKWVIQGRAEIKTMKAEAPAPAPHRVRSHEARVGVSRNGGGAAKTEAVVGGVPKATAKAKPKTAPVEVVGVPAPPPVELPQVGADTWAFLGFAGVFGATVLHMLWKNFRAKVAARATEALKPKV